MTRTRGTQGSGSIRQRKDGRWEGRYTTGRDPGTGKQIQRSVYGATEEEAGKRLRAVTAAIDKGLYIEPAKLTVGQWCDVWISEYTRHLKPGTHAHYEKQIKNHIKPRLGKVKLQALQVHTVQTFINALKTIHSNHSGPLSPKTVKNIHGVLHAALEQAKEIGYIPYNPADNTKLPRREKKDISPFDSDQLPVFLDAAARDPYGRIYKIAVLTGLRQSELIGLTWDCVDFDRGSLYIYRQLQFLKGGYQFTSPKNDKSRRVLVAPDVLSVLKEQRRIQMEWRLKAGEVWQLWGGHDLVFTNEIGDHIKHVSLIKRYKAIVESMGCPDKRFHDLRHTYATMSLQAGVDIKTVQENLGHHSPAFTLERYGHVTNQMQQQGADRLQAFLDSLTKKL